ncbi:nicotinate-nucleotide--dimethylbenzimidazole phosphoribosyltransferase [Candidatus Riflebacteria bacterium]
MKKIRQTIDRIAPFDSVTAEEVRALWAKIKSGYTQLGNIEKVCTKIAVIQGRKRPSVKHKKVFILGADHGIFDEGVSPGQATSTLEMLKDIASGSAYLNTITELHSIDVQVANFGCFSNPKIENLGNFTVGKGTGNFLNENAMSEKQLTKAMRNGIKMFDRLISEPEETIIALGEVGRSNTTTCAAIISALTDCDPALVVDIGSGLDKKGLAHKIMVVNNALENRYIHGNDDVDSLMKVGGFEILGMVGVILRAAEKRVPILLDGFASTTAAFIATRFCPNSKHYFLATHLGGEKGHQFLSRLLDLNPFLPFDIRQGEGLGAALLFPVIESCLALFDKATSRIK